MRVLLIAVALCMGCDDVFQLDRIELEPRFCTEPAQRSATFCADFDQGGDPFAGFVRGDTRFGEIYQVETATVHSPPNAGALIIAGPGSPDARLQVTLGTSPYYRGSLWLYVSTNESNSVVLVRFVLDAAVTILLRSSGLVVETRSMTNRTLMTMTPLPKAAWFEIAFVVDARDPLGGALELTVNGETKTTSFGASNSGTARVNVGPAEPSPENQNAGWRVFCDDVVMRVEDS